MKGGFPGRALFGADIEEMKFLVKTHLDLHIGVWAAPEFQCAVALHLFPVAPVHKSTA